jgi:DUF4097 and DUF4098 domain-containing protein YvlB
MYYQRIAIAVVSLALVAAAMSGAQRNWSEQASERIEHTFGASATLDVDDVIGSIEVVGDGGSNIRVTGERILRASSKENIELGRREVTTEMTEKDGVARIYVNGPFRNHGDGWGSHDRYEVTTNLTIHVPHRTGLRLRTVSGTIRAEQTEGSFDVRGVNGDVAMTSINGSGTVRGVNGALKVVFSASPKEPCDFRTVNGAIDATFPANLAADLKLRTINGSAFTDFDGTALTEGARQNDSRFVYKPRGRANLVVGGGGPELSFATVNGSITIHKATK